MHVFTYGTLMFPEVWKAVVGREFSHLRGQAPGFRIFRVRDAVYPGILVAGSTDAVDGVVYQDIDPESIDRLDRFEDDFYRRRPIVVACDDGRRLEAEAYVVPDDFRDMLTDEPWTGDDFVARGDLDRFLANFAGFERLAKDGN
jgi:gamma-glutamylcyclotransferase (GGCT)/AIG2-like uncharacterized protein YtfP